MNVLILVYKAKLFHLIIFLIFKLAFRAALETVRQFAGQLDLKEYISRIIHPLIRVLDTDAELRDSAMDTLVAIMRQMGIQFQIFTPMVNRVLAKHKIMNQECEVILNRIYQVRKCGK